MADVASHSIVAVVRSADAGPIEADSTFTKAGGSMASFPRTDPEIAALALKLVGPGVKAIQEYRLEITDSRFPHPTPNL